MSQQQLHQHLLLLLLLLLLARRPPLLLPPFGTAARPHSWEGRYFEAIAAAAKAAIDSHAQDPIGVYSLPPCPRLRLTAADCRPLSLADEAIAPAAVPGAEAAAAVIKPMNNLFYAVLGGEYDVTALRPLRSNNSSCGNSGCSSTAATAAEAAPCPSKALLGGP